jgi:glycerophosphoryl diester phosphodiesterase
MPNEAQSRPLIIAHRGASGERPEHTNAAYALAIEQGADYIEPDLVLTRDGVLVCRHENDISATTDVADRPEFAARRARKTIDSVETIGWFSEEFTLAELKTLRCRERLPELRPRSTAFDGQELVPTFAEVLALANAHGVGIYPELKHPSYFTGFGLDPIPALVSDLRQANADLEKVFVQCFETDALRTLASMSSMRFRCVQLIAAEGGPWDRRGAGTAYADMLTDEGLASIRTYAEAIGVEKTLIIPRDEEGRSLAPTDLIARAHAAGLAVHAWTFRAENTFLPAELRQGDASAPDFARQHGDMATELQALYALGIDGAFSDFPGLAVAART